MVRILYMDVSVFDSDEAFEKMCRTVSPQRLVKINRMKQRKDKNLSLGASFLLDCELSKYGKREKDMLYKEENGKPAFENFQELCFSISHSENMTAVAFSETPVGCDIEKIKKARERVSQRLFAEDEIAYIDKAKDKEKAFYSLWTKKESYVKMTGKGLSGLYEGFSVIKGVKGYTFGEYNEIPDYCLSYCINEKEKIEIECIK